MTTNPLSQTDSHTENPVFQLHEINPESSYADWQSQESYSVLWIQQGQGTYSADLHQATFASRSLLFFQAHQPFRLSFEPGHAVQGVALHFSADFYCLESHQAEVGCDGLLFNQFAAPVAVQMNADDEAALTILMSALRRELSIAAPAHEELLLAYLKILLIRAARRRLEQVESVVNNDARPPAVLRRLHDLIERHFQHLHAPADYAALLSMSPKTLSKLARAYYLKPLSSLIQERIIMEAKRELYRTNRSVKEIAFALGFTDQYYFSRFFKQATQVPPLQFRRQHQRQLNS